MALYDCAPQRFHTQRQSPNGMVKSARPIVLATVVGLFGWMFADALFRSGVFVFRDAGHYYYPLFEFIRGEWLAGRVPLWNPYENLGVPLAGNATSSVFYPGTLLFLLPLDYTTLYVGYVTGHVLLAAAAAYRLARHFGASVVASGVAALSYAFSGNVLYQYCNVIFLVGAAWLPLAVLAADRMFVAVKSDAKDIAKSDKKGNIKSDSNGYKWALAFGAVLALITLGGNAEMAYYVVLLAAGHAALLWYKGVPLFPEACESNRSLALRCATSRWARLSLAVGVGLALSAVQVLPSAEFARRSGRGAASVPRTLYELPGYFANKSADRPADEAVHWSDGLSCRRVEPGTHHEHAYHFSVGPWRLIEFVWPNISGRQFPVHRRWLEVIPAEGRLWVPSFYMGLVPLILALGAMRFRIRRAPAHEAWLTWTVVLAVTASFGWYGLGWLLQEIRGMAGADLLKPWLVGGPFGGLYWLATVLVPGWIYFRYPAKLLVIAALGLSMLAAVGWDRAFAGSSSGSIRLRRVVLGLAGISLVGECVTLAIQPFWDDWLARVGPDVLFGPLDTVGAHRDLLMAFCQTAVVSLLFFWLLRQARSGARWPAAVTLVLVAVDLGMANRWMIVCAPADRHETRPQAANIIDRHEKEIQKRQAPSRNNVSLQPGPFNQPYRVYRQRLWIPSSWTRRSSPNRLADAARWDRATLWPKYNLPAGVPLTEVYGTMTPYDYEVFVARRGPPPFALEKETVPFEPGTFSLSNVRYFVLRGNEVLDGGKRIDTAEDRADPDLKDVSVWYRPEHLPRAWIVHQLDVLGSLATDNPAEIRRRTDRVFFAERGLRDLRESALVEFETEKAAFEFGAMVAASEKETSDASGEDRCLVTYHDARQVQIEAKLQRPGLVILFDQFHPGWHLEVKTAGGLTREAPILRVNRVMRGVWLPGGEHRLTYRYRPTSFLVGAVVSPIAWLGLGLVTFFGSFSAWRSRDRGDHA